MVDFDFLEKKLRNSRVLLLKRMMSVEGIGVNYGLLGNNLPPPAQVINFIKSKNIQNIRIFDPNTDILKALEGSGLSVILGTRNEDLQRLASDPTFATNWVLTNVIPHASTVNIAYISAGNEVIPGPLATFVLGALQNLDSALKSNNLNISVSTTISLQVLANSYPPSNGAFSEDAIQFMQPITQFLTARKYPLLSNVYPYFAYSGNPDQIQLSYALFQNTSPTVSDGTFQYNNLYDAMVDTLYAALEKVGQPTVEVVVTETGWPSAGDVYATTDNAQIYANNLIAHVSSGQGTPRRPGKVLKTYIFALFNENQKPAGAEQNFGLFYPDMTEVYHVNLIP
ncbi:putative glucan endo-1,3-beta-glucosidase GVI [Capsicum baccatum]|uniref:Glucan endo-1,3-beta-glucosidase GVI n=1 Tax=Capsicum baccatum TaxID=33114 RepID=A0A2G2X6Q6_CAPBA|nr:putative glucan endo-1,3-beta-glucosidase GVI [Capsicum baccatum]